MVSLWFPRLPSERVLRARPIEAPFALTHRQSNTERVYCLNEQAEKQGLKKGIGLGEARVLCPGLQTSGAEPLADARFMQVLARWAGQYCPWVGIEEDGLALDISGSAHLRGGESPLLADMEDRLRRAGLSHRAGLADTRGAAWALARNGGGIAPPGDALSRLAPLPITALRLPPATCNSLQRLGIRTVRDLANLPRSTLTRRFGAEVLLRLDQALGTIPEPVSPLPPPAPFAFRMTLPEPIGLLADVNAGLERLLAQLCNRLEAREMGARKLVFTARRVDQASVQAEVRLARPMRDTARIARLFERGLEALEAGYGIDQIRLEAVEVEKLPLRQISTYSAARIDGLADIITRLGNRIGLENITRYLPADSHLPEKSFSIAPAAYSEASSTGWASSTPRPLLIFPAEPIAAGGPMLPKRFRWRRLWFHVAEAIGPERIAPEWWFDHPDWRSGVRDYWRVLTHEGRRLWLFFTPQNPGWFVQGEFP